MATDRWLLARFARANGTSKDWAIAVFGSDVIVRHGKTGQAMQRKPIERKSWRRQDASSEARRRLQEQEDQGYEILGTCSFGADGKVADLQSNGSADIPVNTDQKAATPKREADIYFEVNAASWQRLFEVMELSVGRIAEHHESSWTTRQGLPTAIPVIEGWSPAFDQHSGIGRVRHSGSLSRSSGVGALVFLLTLRLLASDTDDVQVKVVKQDGSEIHKDLRKEASLLETFGSSVDDATPVCEDAGLMPKRIRLSQIDTGQDDCWF